MQTIPELWRQCKPLLEGWLGEWGLILAVFLVGLTSFGLGRLSALIEARPPVSVRQAPAEVEPKGMAVGGLYVAARSGSAYYFPWCSGAARIRPENRVWFDSETAARAASYKPAKGCDGLGSE